MSDGSEQFTVFSQDDAVAQVLWSYEHGRFCGLGRALTLKLLQKSPTVRLYISHLAAKSKKLLEERKRSTDKRRNCKRGKVYWPDKFKVHHVVEA